MFCTLTMNLKYISFKECFPFALILRETCNIKSIGNQNQGVINIKMFRIDLFDCICKFLANFSLKYEKHSQKVKY